MSSFCVFYIIFSLFSPFIILFGIISLHNIFIFILFSARLLCEFAGITVLRSVISHFCLCWFRESENVHYIIEWHYIGICSTSGIKIGFDSVWRGTILVCNCWLNPIGYTDVTGLNLSIYWPMSYNTYDCVINSFQCWRKPLYNFLSKCVVLTGTNTAWKQNDFAFYFHVENYLIKCMHNCCYFVFNCYFF